MAATRESPPTLARLLAELIVEQLPDVRSIAVRPTNGEHQ